MYCGISHEKFQLRDGITDGLFCDVVSGQLHALNVTGRILAAIDKK